MPRFFFDIHTDMMVTRDDDGIELPNVAAVQQTAMTVLPAIASDESPAEGDQYRYVVVVSDEHRRPWYSATLNYAGAWLTP